MPKPVRISPEDVAVDAEFQAAFPDGVPSPDATDTRTLGQIAAGMVRTVVDGQPDAILAATAADNTTYHDRLNDFWDAIGTANDARARGDHDEADKALAFAKAFDMEMFPDDQVTNAVAAINAVPDRPADDTPKPKRARKPRATAAPAKPDISGAFDKGARLNLPPLPDDEVDPALTGRGKRIRVPKSTSARPTGSDELTSLFAAGLITLIAFTMGDEFQPTGEEALDLARPLGNIMARRIDLAAKLGQDANDVVAFAIAMMAYMVRVGPIAGGKVREYVDDRRARGSGQSILPEPPNPGGTGRMALGDDGGQGTSVGTPYDPLAAIAKARANGLGVLDRDLGDATNGHSAMADQR